MMDETEDDTNQSDDTNTKRRVKEVQGSHLCTPVGVVTRFGMEPDRCKD